MMFFGHRVQPAPLTAPLTALRTTCERTREGDAVIVDNKFQLIPRHRPLYFLEALRHRQVGARGGRTLHGDDGIKAAREHVLLHRDQRLDRIDDLVPRVGGELEDEVVPGGYHVHHVVVRCCLCGDRKTGQRIGKE